MMDMTSDEVAVMSFEGALDRVVRLTNDKRRYSIASRGEQVVAQWQKDFDHALRDLVVTANAAITNTKLRQRDRKIVCLCGSTRFYKEYTEINLAETLAGNIVLSIGAAVASDDTHFGHLLQAERDEIKRKLDELHLDKIAMADEVYVINKHGYIGESTAREIAHARALGKPIRWHVPPNTEQPPDCLSVNVDTWKTVSDALDVAEKLILTDDGKKCGWCGTTTDPEKHMKECRVHPLIVALHRTGRMAPCLVVFSTAEG